MMDAIFASKHPDEGSATDPWHYKSGVDRQCPARFLLVNDPLSFGRIARGAAVADFTRLAIASEKDAGGPNDPQAEVSAIPTLEDSLPKTSALRRGARKLLRFFRPFVAPFLNRLQLRLQAAIVETGVPARAESIAVDLVGLRSEFRGQIQSLQQLHAESRDLHTGVSDLHSRVSDLESHILAVLAAISRQFAQQSRAATDQNNVLRNYIDVLLNRQVVPLANDLLGIRTPDGFVVVPADDERMVLYLSSSTHEPGTRRLLKQLIAPGDYVVDVGAHIGVIALSMARAVGPTGTVLALEPEPSLQVTLRKTAVVNSLESVMVILQTAVGDYRAAARFDMGSTTTAESSLLTVAHEKTAITVEIDTLDNLLPSRQKVSLIKLDVEGAEPSVIAGMSRVLEANPDMALIAELGPSRIARSGGTVEAWLEGFANAGLEVAYEIEEQSGICKPLRPLSELEDIYSLNLVFARSGSSVIDKFPRA